MPLTPPRVSTLRSAPGRTRPRSRRGGAALAALIPAVTVALLVPAGAGAASAPTAQFNWSPGIGQPGQPVTFDASASTNCEGGSDLDQYTWFFDHGTGTPEMRAGATVTYTWADPGQYEVTLNVVDNTCNGDLRGNTTRQFVQVGDAPDFGDDDQGGDVFCNVPKLLGKKLKAAKSALAAANCALGKVKRKHASKKKRGRVIAQSPKAGAVLDAGSKVAVTVGKK
jgi:PKD domain/PASTA domain